ncbi:helix-turn-helix domain-containing protein [Streptomyces europaeiscabiei]|uniref:helix-turn-helix domain-containing protein n=1 Tax=Streptomyces europaeiscabiei TaxID=146819 RepID=UPI002E172FC3
MTDTARITVDVLDGPSVRYRDGAYFQGSKAILYTYDLSPQAKVLWLVLDDHAQQNRMANPGRKRLAELMNVSSLRTLDSYVTELKEQGWLIVKGDVFDGDTNDYALTIPKGLNVLADDYKRSTKELEVNPKPKIAKKPRAALEAKETDIAPRYALSYNHTREDVPAPISRGVEKALELSQSARRDTKALQSKTPQRKALPAAQAAKPKEKGPLERAREIGTYEAFLEVLRSEKTAERYYNKFKEEKEGRPASKHPLAP